MARRSRRICEDLAGEGRRRQTKEAQLTDGRHWTLVVFFNSTASCRIGE
jgi:hypothetical protein